MKDVAARAGVSYQTVSRVVNESPHVKLETHARVAEAMGELRYRPNNAARHLVSRRSRIIGFIGSLTFHGPVRIMVSVEQTAKKHGYNVMFAELPEVNAAEVRRAIDELCARQVDGIVILIPLELEMEFIRDVCRMSRLSRLMWIWVQVCLRSWLTRIEVRSSRSGTSPG